MNWPDKKESANKVLQSLISAETEKKLTHDESLVLAGISYKSIEYYDSQVRPLVETEISKLLSDIKTLKDKLKKFEWIKFEGTPPEDGTWCLIAENYNDAVVKGIHCVTGRSYLFQCGKFVYINPYNYRTTEVEGKVLYYMPLPKFIQP